MSWTSRLWAWLLLAIDRLLGTHLVERELARKQAKIEQVMSHLQVVNRDLDALVEELALYRLALCLVELKARSEHGGTDDWLRFSPRDGDSTWRERPIRSATLRDPVHSATLQDWLGERDVQPAEAEPARVGDEALLDDAIECLVKPGLATLDVEPVGPGSYTYRLHPDWAAIVARLSETTVAPELLPWLEKQT